MATDIIEQIMQDKTESIIVGINNSNVINVNNKVLSILHLNIRSLNRNYDNLVTFMETYSCRSVDVIVLSECWNIENPGSFNIVGYESHYNFSKINQNDGVFIFIKSTLNADINIIKLLNCNIAVSRITFSINGTSCAVNAMYRSPNSNVRLFLQDLNNYLLDTLLEEIEIIVGDININLKENSDEISEYTGMLNLHGFESYINDSTRATNLSDTCIDHIFLRRRGKGNALSFQSYIFHSDVTDHYPIMLGVSDATITGQHTAEVKKKIEQINYDKLITSLTSESWDNVIQNNDPELATQNFTTTLLKYI